LIRATLTSPTQLLLEHPMLSPVAESEFAVVGLKEYEKNRRDWIRYGVLIGLVAAVLATAALSFALSVLR